MKVKRIIIGGITGGFIVSLIPILITIIPDMQANGGLHQWFLYRSRIAGFDDVLGIISISLALGFIGGALGTAGTTANKQQGTKTHQLGNTNETVEDKNNELIDSEIKAGFKSGALSVLIILAAILLFLILCASLAILFEIH